MVFAETAGAETIFDEFVGGAYITLVEFYGTSEIFVELAGVAGELSIFVEFCGSGIGFSNFTDTLVEFADTGESLFSFYGAETLLLFYAGASLLSISIFLLDIGCGLAVDEGAGIAGIPRPDLLKLASASSFSSYWSCFWY